MDLLESPAAVIRVYKRAVGNPSYVWANLYEVSFPTAPPSEVGTWIEILDTWIETEQLLHTPNVEFVKATASTWVPGDTTGAEGYDPQAFLVRLADAGTVGARSISGDPLPRQAVLFVRRDVTFGHTGKLFYRGVLSELDMQATTALDPRLTSAATTALEAIVQEMYTAFQTALGLEVGHEGTLAMIHASPSTEDLTIRPINGLHVAGMAINQPNHRYYDRA